MVEKTGQVAQEGTKMRKSGKRRNEGKKGTMPPCRQKPADTELSLVDKGVRSDKNSHNPFDHWMLLKPPLPTMPGHLRASLFQLSQGQPWIFLQKPAFQSL